MRRRRKRTAIYTVALCCRLHSHFHCFQPTDLVLPGRLFPFKPAAYLFASLHVSGDSGGSASGSSPGGSRSTAGPGRSTTSRGGGWESEIEIDMLQVKRKRCGSRFDANHPDLEPPKCVFQPCRDFRSTKKVHLSNLLCQKRPLFPKMRRRRTCVEYWRTMVPEVLDEPGRAPAPLPELHTPISLCRRSDAESMYAYFGSNRSRCARCSADSACWHAQVT